MGYSYSRYSGLVDDMAAEDHMIAQICGARIVRDGCEIELYISFNDKERAKAIGNYRWDAGRKCWRFPETKLDAIQAAFPNAAVHV